MDGLLPIWKPVGITSFDVIREFKKSVKPQYKVGHAGTLDPFAEGVLILMLGRGTQMFTEIQSWPKRYRATAKLNAISDTLDRTGVITWEVIRNTTSESELKDASEQFVGETEQSVPQYSAAKYKGKPLYKYARKGIVTPEKKKLITVYSIEVIQLTNLFAELLITCSSGTYIRQLSYDIFQTLGIESYLDQLVRESVGVIERTQCLTIDQLTDEDMVRQRVQPVRGESVSQAGH